MKNSKADVTIILLSIIVAALVSYLANATFSGADQLPWDVHLQPKLHATLNSITAILLLVGFYAVKNKNITLHRFCMFGALVASAFFLVSYVLYHGLTDSTSYGGDGLMKYLYYFILISHILLAVIIFPLVLMTVHRALTNQLDAHRKLAKYTFPMWLYVAITGVLVYLMISPYYGA